VPGFEEVQRHRIAHIAYTDESEFHFAASFVQGEDYHIPEIPATGDQ